MGVTDAPRGGRASRTPMEQQTVSITERLQKATKLFLDTAPVIYFVEENERYLPLVEIVFDLLDNGLLIAVTSPVTLAECLVIPYRMGKSELRQSFVDLITSGSNTEFAALDQKVAEKAAELRAKYNLTLTDAFQVAAALTQGCDAFLTNDVTLKRVTELDMIVLDEMEFGETA